MPNLYLSIKDLTARYGVDRSTIWRWQQSEGFPAPVKLSPQCARWPMAAVVAWEAGRA